MTKGFHGAKAAIFLGEDLLVYQRDERGPWPLHWDFPGGGREGDETPFDCLRRETEEEFGLTLIPEEVVWEKSFPAMKDPSQLGWFFVLRKPAADLRQIRFGAEGLSWRMLPLSDVAELPDLVPGLRGRLTLWLQGLDPAPI